MSAPALRFESEAGREFSDWKERPLGAVVENYGGTALEEFVSEEGTHNLVLQQLHCDFFLNTGEFRFSTIPTPS